MKENKELRNHVRALGEWAAQDKNRVTFVMCKEDDGDKEDFHSSVVGRMDKVATTLFRCAMKEETVRDVILLAAEMIKHPLVGMMVSIGSSQEGHRPEKEKDDFSEAIGGLFEAIKRKFGKND